MVRAIFHYSCLLQKHIFIFPLFVFPLKNNFHISIHGWFIAFQLIEMMAVFTFNHLFYFHIWRKLSLIHHLKIYFSLDTKEIHYESVEREDISSSVIFKLYIMISEILLRIGPIITLAVLNALIIYKFLRIAKRRHQLKRYSLQLSQGGLPSTLSENMNGPSAISRSSQTTEVR